MIGQAELVRLLPALRQGNGRAQEALFEQCYAVIAAYVLKRSRSEADAEDIVSHTFTRCFNEISHLRKPEFFRYWLFRLAYRCTIDFYRKQKKHAEVVTLSKELTEMIPGRERDPAKIALSKEWFEQFYVVLEKLRVEDRSYIVSLLEGQSISDMAIIMGKSQGAVKEGIHRARIRLARILAETPYFGDDGAIERAVKKYQDKEIK